MLLVDRYENNLEYEGQSKCSRKCGVAL